MARDQAKNVIALRILQFPNQLEWVCEDGTAYPCPHDAGSRPGLALLARAAADLGFGEAEQLFQRLIGVNGEGVVLAKDVT
jgi:hypothetical protein